MNEREIVIEFRLSGIFNINLFIDSDIEFYKYIYSNFICICIHICIVNKF